MFYPLAISISFVMCLTLFKISHPVSMALLMILYAFGVGALSLKMTTGWFLYLLVLIFLGGVMVLVVYMTTLSANEKFITPPTEKMGVIISLASLSSLSFFFSPTPQASPPCAGWREAPLGYLYEPLGIFMLLLCFIMLLLALVSVVKVVKCEEGPLVMRL